MEIRRVFRVTESLIYSILAACKSGDIGWFIRKHDLSSEACIGVISRQLLHSQVARRRSGCVIATGDVAASSSENICIWKQCRFPRVALRDAEREAFFRPGNRHRRGTGSSSTPAARGSGNKKVGKISLAARRGALSLN